MFLRRYEQIAGSLLSDARFAARVLRKSPIFTAVVVAVLALGTGAVTTVFSAMNAAVLRPLPGVADPDGLVSVRPAHRDGAVAEQMSYGRYASLRDRSRMFRGLAAWGRVALTISTDAGGTAAMANMVSANYFDVLGVRPSVGRFFAEEEGRTPGAHPVLVLSHAFWTVRLGADIGAIGRTVFVNGHPFTVIGVAPRGFHGIYTGLKADAWVPLMMQPQLRPRSNLTTASWLWVFGRLGKGGHGAAAESELAGLVAALRAESGEPERPGTVIGMRLSPLTGLPGGEGRALLGFMSLMLAAAALVLVIACVNVASMLSARYAARQREMAVRTALGAGRQRLLRQLMTEVLALFLVGALGGFVVAQVATAALERLPLPGNVPLTLELSPDLRVLAFAVAVTVAAGLLVGLPSALRGARRDVTSALRDDSSGSGRRRTLIGRSLVVGQLAFSLVLLVVAGLFGRALERGQRLPIGFNPDGVMTVTLEPESWGYDAARARAFYRTLGERVRSIPGVTAASYTGRMPLMMSKSVDDITTSDGLQVSIQYATVDRAYFDVLELPLVRGRDFGDADDDRAPKVAIVNESCARRVWPDGDALGGTFRFRGELTTVVGIARDAKYAALDEATPSFAYFPIAQISHPTRTLLVRTAGSPESYASSLQQTVQSIDPLLPRPPAASMRRAIGIVLLPQRAAALVTGALGFVGLLLAVVGLYGIMAFSVGRRTREIGIRVALGARRGEILGMVMREGLRFVVLGVVLGLVFAAVVTRLLARWLFDVNPVDVATFAAMSLLFVAVAAVATYVPARRAATADPLEALRQGS